VDSDHVMRPDADFWHFMPSRYLTDVIDRRLFHFKNVRGYNENNFINVDGRLFSAESLAYFSFSRDPDCTIKHYFWKRYGDNGLGVAVGFRQAGWRQDSGPIATIAFAHSDRQVSNLYLPAKDSSGTTRKCFYSMVFYSYSVTASPLASEAPNEDDLLWSNEICFTEKPPEDAPDTEERLILLGCTKSENIDYSPMRPYLYPKAIVFGYNMPASQRDQTLEQYLGKFLLFQSESKEQRIELRILEQYGNSHAP